MKLCRYGPRGAEKPGLVDADGRIRALNVADITPDLLSPEGLGRLAAIDPAPYRWSTASPATGCR